MLSLVGTAVAINPDARLRSLAREREWEIRDFRTARKAARIGVPSALALARRAGTGGVGIPAPITLISCAASNYRAEHTGMTIPEGAAAIIGSHYRASDYFGSDAKRSGSSHSPSRTTIQRTTATRTPPRPATPRWWPR